MKTKKAKEKKPVYITTAEALKIIEKSWYGPTTTTTFYKWIKTEELGFKFSGRFIIDKAKLMRFLRQEQKFRSKGAGG